jgi:hypothetical protein
LVYIAEALDSETVECSLLQYLQSALGCHLLPSILTAILIIWTRNAVPLGIVRGGLGL